MPILPEIITQRMNCNARIYAGNVSDCSWILVFSLIKHHGGLIIITHMGQFPQDGNYPQKLSRFWGQMSYPYTIEFSLKLFVNLHEAYSYVSDPRICFEISVQSQKMFFLGLLFSHNLRNTSKWVNFSS